MARRTSTKTVINNDLQKGRRHTQRERLIAAMIAVANREGHAGATVSSTIAQAGVSRPTFYEYFADREACFMTAVQESFALLSTHVGEALESDGTPSDATTVTIRALLQFTRNDPAIMRFLVNEPLAAGKEALNARERHLGELAKRIQASEQRAERAGPQVPLEVLLGAIFRLLGARLRRGERRYDELAEQIVDWAARYERPSGAERWRTLEPTAAPSQTPPTLEPVLREPEPLGRGRPRLSSEQTAENHRHRILLAVARLARGQGYDATTVTDVAREARVDVSVFYSLFSNKQEAFMAFHEISFQQLMAVTANAFFQAEQWPERSWQAGLAFTHFLAENPLVAHVGFVEAYAVGPGAVQRVEDSHVAFTMFLQEGYQYAPQSEPPSQLALEGIVAAVFEIVYRQVRADQVAELGRVLAFMAVFFLTPFLGAEQTDAFIDANLAAQ